MGILSRLRSRLGRDPVETFPKIAPDHFVALPSQGWTTVTFDEQDSLRDSLIGLSEASKSFFALPQDYKSQFLTSEGSEDGWNRIPGEKEFITLRTMDRTPKELQAPATAAWLEASKYLNEVLACIARSLELAPEALTQFSLPCSQLGTEKTATMLRLFRYEGHKAKVVAEPHADLGLLSFVIGDTPGLEVFNLHTQSFWPVEKSYTKTAGTLLGGRQLERLTNGRYRAGGHQVRAYESSSSISERDAAALGAESDEGRYRYSIVFVLRAHSPVIIDTDKMTTKLTGPFEKPMRGITAGQLFADTKGKHYNINTGITERDKQKQQILEKRQATSATSVATG